MEAINIIILNLFIIVGMLGSYLIGRIDAYEKYNYIRRKTISMCGDILNTKQSHKYIKNKAKEILKILDKQV